MSDQIRTALVAGLSAALQVLQAPGQALGQALNQAQPQPQAPAPQPQAPAPQPQAPAPQPQAPAPQPQAGVTQDQLISAFRQYIQVAGAEQAQAYLQSLGVARVSELPQEKWAPVYEALQTALKPAG